MKIMTVLGTRPEIIRLSRVIEKLDRLGEHVLVHTGQNFDHALSDVFFDEMEVRRPDHTLAVKSETDSEQIGKVLSGCETLFRAERPDRLLILGDTNSALSALVAKRIGIPVFHMEAGNRGYDDRVPEEVNRRVIDHCSDVLMPYTERSRQNLIREGIASQRVFVTGNPIHEVIEHYQPRIEASKVLETLGLEPGKYFLITMHRAENVDVEQRLRSFTAAFDLIQKEYGVPLIVSTHPRTRARMEAFGVSAGNDQVRFLEPFGFFDFVALEKSAMCVLTDSGTVQEECAILGVRNATIRDVTERPETIECGSNLLTGSHPDSILSAVRAALELSGDWAPPPGYLAQVVSDTAVKITLGHHEFPNAPRF